MMQGAKTTMETQSPTPPAGEVVSSLTLVDFLWAWYGLRKWFLGGLILVSLVTIFCNKVLMLKYYRAEARVFVGRVIPNENRIGISDLEAAAVGRNDQIMNLVQSVLAEQYLTSAQFLLEVTNRLKAGSFASTGRTTKWDLYDLLHIRDKDQAFREAKLTRLLQDNLIQVRQIQNTGAMIFSVELPDPVAAQNFTNSCVDVLEERMIDYEFHYYDAALKDYRRKLATEVEKSMKLAQSRVDLDWDKYPPRAQQNEIIKTELVHQATWIAELNTKISKLDLATTESARNALAPVRVIDHAMVPIKKSRPQAILNTLMADALYTFVFMFGLAVFSYVRWSLAARVRPENEA